MAATRSWADLSSDVLVSIAGAVGNGLGAYARLRAVCTAWRAALAPPLPGLLGLADGGRSEPVRASVFSLPAQRFFDHYMGSCKLAYSLQDQRSMPVGNLFFSMPVQPAHSYASIVGSGSGRVAVAIHSQESVSGSSPRNYWTASIFLLRPRTGEEAVLLPPSKARDECVRKVVFAPNRPEDWPTVVAMYGRNKVAYIDPTGHKKWTTVDFPGKLYPVEHLVDLAFDAGGRNLYCLDIRGGVRVLRIPHAGHDTQDQEPAVVVEPLLTPLPIFISDAYAPLYNVATAQNSAKHLFFCDGSLYQVWQTKRRYRDEIFVLRFDPGRWPCWDAVEDLGGCSVFIGESSNPVVVRAGAGVPGVRADCVYWIRLGVPIAMVYDVATGTSEVYCKNKGNCWYFDDDNDMTSDIGDKNQKRKRCSRF